MWRRGAPEAASMKHYRVLRTLGEGAYAKVKLALHLVTGTEVAIKFICKSRQARLEFLAREVDCMKALQHPNIIQLFEVLDTREDLLLVMEYAGGGDLQEYLLRHGRLEEPEARGKFEQILAAVTHCHARGIAHRDLKPENILMDSEHNLKLGDFGLSIECAGAALSTFCGSPEYAAPEIFEHRAYAGPAADVWSLGVVLYRMVTGALPFRGSNLLQLRGRVLSGRFHLPNYLSAPCRDLLGSMMALDPQGRSSLEAIQQHPWVRASRELLAVRQPSPSHQDAALTEAMVRLGYRPQQIQAAVGERRFDAVMGTYLILRSRRRARPARREPWRPGLPGGPPAGVRGGAAPGGRAQSGYRRARPGPQDHLREDPAAGPLLRAQQQLPVELPGRGHLGGLWHPHVGPPAGGLLGGERRLHPGPPAGGRPGVQRHVHSGPPGGGQSHPHVGPPAGGRLGGESHLHSRPPAGGRPGPERQVHSGPQAEDSVTRTSRPLQGDAWEERATSIPDPLQEGAPDQSATSIPGPQAEDSVTRTSRPLQGDAWEERATSIPDPLQEGAPDQSATSIPGPQAEDTQERGSAAPMPGPQVEGGQEAKNRTLSAAPQPPLANLRPPPRRRWLPKFRRNAVAPAETLGHEDDNSASVPSVSSSRGGLASGRRIMNALLNLCCFCRPRGSKQSSSAHPPDG
ncbi:serine/threonine-protein kinase MARK2-like [Talpa occidentalis]|uniref:serine/threonine-protein kinase MARK2-like n=1 Tax=Talpa occidentalis TaxID=50954 RepID=UPI0023F9667D|nr:serine/threonine-protein kinase MARK2-like [Talpa occidentalis]